MSNDLTHLVRIDPAFDEYEISFPVYRMTVEEPDHVGDRWWKFSARVQYTERTPTFGIRILLLDELGLPLVTDSLGFTSTIDKMVTVAEKSYWQLKDLPTDVQIVLSLD